MDDEQRTAAGRRRGKGAEATARAGALERLKALRGGGRRSENGGAGYSIKMENPIYDTVPEEEYDKLVARRREEAHGFIVDDGDGGDLGYGDEGQEEDWSLAGFPPSSGDDSDGELNIRKRRRAEKKEKETAPVKKVNAALTAAAAMMGKQSISKMFTSTVFKNKDSAKVKSVDCESIVDDVIAEFAPDENDRERRRKAQLGSKPLFVPMKSENHAVSHINLLANATNGGNNEADGDYEDAQEENGNLLSEMKEEAEVAGTGDDPMAEDAAVEVKVGPSVEVKKEKGGEKGRVLNAKIGVVEREGLVSARSVWEEMRSVGDGGLKEEGKSEGKPEFEISEDGSTQFYIIDAYEEVVGLTIPKLYLFGKVKAGNTYHSCCVIVKNMQRCVFAIPNSSIFCTDEIIRLEKDAEESRISPTEFRKKLQDVSYELKNEIATQLVNQNVSSFSMAPVKRKYAFERSDIPIGENYVLKINYPFEKAPLPSDLKGETFCALLGTHSSALELFLVKRRIKGPSWLSISRFSTCPPSRRTSWCKFEITVDSPKDISVSSSKKTTEIPPVIVSAISLKTAVNEKQNVEIVSASVICCHKAKVDTPMLASEWKKPGMLSHFSVIRQFGREIYPMGFLTEAADINTKAGSNVLCVIKHRDCNERALLIRLMTELHKLDSDVLVGHNISGFDLDVLLRRAKACGVPGNMWSKIGRLNRDVMPNFTKRNSFFGSGASPGMMSCIAGRLLCDTYLCSRDLLKEVSYSLTQLAKSRLNKDRKEIGPHDIPAMFQASKSLIELVEYGETDAWLSMELMFHLSVLPLTRQLTNISGNLWGKSLQGARAQRVEYLLLHAFHAKKFIVPDKISSYAKEVKMTKKRTNHGAVERNANQLDNDDVDFDNEIPQNEHSKGKKGPAYAGGLVLEPKKGLYDRYVLLLDFNSLYPSIIQEYNICFTTVERSSDELVPRLPSSTTTGVLPELLKNLVERRRMVKSWMKTASGLKMQQLDIQQQALKLIANSMYGCLGFSNSRFYAKPLAELITLQGREILQSTVDLVQNNLNLEVIYGDTDSIMIYSGLDDIEKAKAISGKVIREVNKKYRCLEIDLDGLYKRMLLLKKKKYAAVKVQLKDGMPYEVIERKGLDMVRRDWSLLSKELGDFCLAQILSGGSCEDVVESIHNSLMKVQEDMRNGQVALEKYVITKTLTKQPETYPDAKNQPHVLVALRLKQSGYTTGCSAGDTVPYVICCEQGANSGSSTGIAQRARHPDELKQDDGNWMIDIDYYLAQQIHPVVSRLCASIQGTSPERLADCLGLDSSKFKSKSSEGGSSDPSSSLLFSVDDEERYQSCEPLILTCPSCSGTLNCPAVFSSICKSITEKPTKPQVEETISNFWRVMRCPKCLNEGDAGRLTPAMVANQVKRQADGFVSTYYKGLMMCDDETCQHSTRRINLQVIGDSERGTVCPNYPRCNGHLIRKYTEADLYRQLSYFCYLLDTRRSMEKVKMDAGIRISVERELTKVEPVVELAASTVQKIRDRCAYGWIRLSDLVITV